MAGIDSTSSTKACTKCGVIKALEEFHKAASRRDGRKFTCKACDKIYSAQRYIQKRDELREYYRVRYLEKSAVSRAESEKKKLRALEEATKRCAACGEVKLKELFAKAPKRPDGVRPYCKDCSNAANRAYRAEFPERASASSKKWADANPEKRRAKALRWNLENPGRATKLVVEWQKRKMETDPMFRFISQTRQAIRKSIRKMGYRKSGTTSRILGCDWAQFRKHIEAQFLKGMSWENRSEWHIDHIVPISSASSQEDVLRLNHFTNLRPLWARDNCAKSSKAFYLI